MALRASLRRCFSYALLAAILTVLDMNKSVDRRQVLTALGIILALSCVPTLLVVFSQIAGRMFPSILIGIALYFVFLRKK